MNPTNALHDLGQSLWLDNITRNLVNSGTLQRHVDYAAGGTGPAAADELLARDDRTWRPPG
jgi:glucose-6-phosphate 1-dehydrogenase